MWIVRMRLVICFMLLMFFVKLFWIVRLFVRWMKFGVCGRLKMSVSGLL